MMIAIEARSSGRKRGDGGRPVGKSCSSSTYSDAKAGLIIHDETHATQFAPDVPWATIDWAR